MPTIAREFPSAYDRLPHFDDNTCFDDETCLRPDDETRARPFEALSDAPLAHTAHTRALNVPYEALPSLEVARPFDAYEVEFVEHDPAAQLRAARHESMRVRGSGEREGSGPRTLPQPATSPPPPHVAARGPAPFANDVGMPAGFAKTMSMPPLGTPSPVGVYAPTDRPPAVVPTAPLMTPSPPGVAYTEFDQRARSEFGAHAPTTHGGGPPPQALHAAHPLGHPLVSPMSMAATTPSRYAHPVGHALQPPTAQRSKAGRFAWFVFGGVTFGLLFFALGYGLKFIRLDGLSAKAPTAPQTVATAPKAPATPQTVATAPKAPAAVAPRTATAPTTPPAAVSPELSAQAAPAPAAARPTEHAAAPRTTKQRAVAQRPAGSPSGPSGPRPLPNSGSVDADDVPSSSPSRPFTTSGDKPDPMAGLSGVGNLLSDGLAP